VNNYALEDISTWGGAELIHFRMHSLPVNSFSLQTPSRAGEYLKRVFSIKGGLLSLLTRFYNRTAHTWIATAQNFANQSQLHTFVPC
jgi:hypothetical protein